MKSVKLSIMGLVVIIIVNLYFIQDAFSWSEKTHKGLSVYAAKSSVLNKYKGDYLSNLGFNKGLKIIFEWDGSPTIKRGYIKDWISEGARLEDEGSYWDMVTNHARFNNHFHNPLKPWDEAGLNDTFLMKTFTGISSIKWAQDGANQQNFPDGDWSWNAIRTYYYLALTSTTDLERQANFARTFRGLGHQMHLIQDAAVPAHVRNDAHPEDTLSGVITPIGFEKWAGEKDLASLVVLKYLQRIGV